MSKRAKIYIILTLLLSWITTIILYRTGNLLKFVALIMLAPAIVAFALRLTSKKNKEIIFNPNAKGLIPFLKAVLFAYLYPILIISTCAVFGALIYKIRINGQFFADMYSYDNFIFFLSRAAVSISIILSFGEEYGWRGLLLPELNKTYSKVKSSTITGIVWALYHFPVLILLNVEELGFKHSLIIAIVQAIAAFVFSYAFAYCYFISNRIYPTVIMHTMWNMYNPRILGSVYENTEGVLLPGAPVLMVNGEGVFGIVLGGIATIFIIQLMKKRKVDKINVGNTKEV